MTDHKTQLLSNKATYGTHGEKNDTEAIAGKKNKTRCNTITALLNYTKDDDISCFMASCLCPVIVIALLATFCQTADSISHASNPNNQTNSSLSNHTQAGNGTHEDPFNYLPAGIFCAVYSAIPVTFLLAKCYRHHQDKKRTQKKNALKYPRSSTTGSENKHKTSEMMHV